MIELEQYASLFQNAKAFSPKKEGRKSVPRQGSQFRISIKKIHESPIDSKLSVNPPVSKDFAN